MLKRISPLVNLSNKQLRFQSILIQKPIVGGAAVNCEKDNYVVPYKQKLIRENYNQNLVRNYSAANLVRPALYEEVKDLPNHKEKLLIDVRETEELKQTGQIPTSVHIPLGVIKYELGTKYSAEKFKSKHGREKPDTNTEIIFHCMKGKRAQKAAEVAVNLGYKNVKNYEGSWSEWAEREGLAKQN